MKNRYWNNNSYNNYINNNNNNSNNNNNNINIHGNQHSNTVYLDSYGNYHQYEKSSNVMPIPGVEEMEVDINDNNNNNNNNNIINYNEYNNYNNSNNNSNINNNNNININNISNGLLYISDIRKEINDFWKELQNDFNFFEQTMENALQTNNKNNNSNNNSNNNNNNSINEKDSDTNSLTPLKIENSNSSNKNSISSNNNNSNNTNNERFHEHTNSTLLNSRQSTSETNPNYLFGSVEEIIFLILPHALSKKVEICKKLLSNGFYICKSREHSMPSLFFEELFENYKHEAYYKDLCKTMSEGPFMVLSLYRVNGIERMKSIAGNKNPKIAKRYQPNSLRALFGESIARCGIIFTTSREEAKQQREELFFGEELISNDSQNEFAIVLIKPDTARNYGNTIRSMFVGNGFEIINEKLIKIPKSSFKNINSFLYTLDCPNNLLKESFDYLSSDPCIICLINKNNCYKDLIKLIGDRDPNIAKMNNSNSIRGTFGVNIIRNCIDATLDEESFENTFPLFFQQSDLPPYLTPVNNNNNQQFNY